MSPIHPTSAFFHLIVDLHSSSCDSFCGHRVPRRKHWLCLGYQHDHVHHLPLYCRDRCWRTYRCCLHHRCRSLPPGYDTFVLMPVNHSPRQHVEDRPKYQSILMSGHGIAAVIGPLLGGGSFVSRPQIHSPVHRASQHLQRDSRGDGVFGLTSPYVSSHSF